MRALFVQWIAILLVLCVAYPFFAFEKITGLPWHFLVWIIGTTALLLSIFCRQAYWWWGIHFLFAPALYFFLQLQLPPIWFLLTFLVLAMIFRGAASHQVPLFLTNSATLSSLERLLQTQCLHHQPLRMMDLGAGIGTVVVFLAKRFPQVEFYAIENSPLPYFLGKLRTHSLPNIHWQFGNLEKQNLNEMHCVYAFLSPAVMPKLWVKVRKEMPDGTLFISNSFAVPNVKCTRILNAESARPIFCYALGEKRNNLV